MFIDRAMIERVSKNVCVVVEVVATKQEQREGLDEMVFESMELPAALEMLGPVVHRRVAKALGPILRKLVE